MAPAELEAVLVSHPKISDAAVTSIPDERQGEAPKAFIVKKDEGLTEKEIMEFMAGKVRERERERDVLLLLVIISSACTSKAVDWRSAVHRCCSQVSLRQDP